MFRLAVVALTALVAAAVGAAVTAANTWGSPALTACRDTVDGGVVIMPMCVGPQSPAWALALGALVPLLVVITVGTPWLRRR